METPRFDLKSDPAARRFRAGLLGAVAVVAIGAAAMNGVVSFPQRAFAQTQSAQPLSGPASFADIVDRVKGAVVSVKVQMVETADDGASMPFEGFGQGPNNPLDRFFRQFGEPGGPGMPHRQMRKAIAQGSGFFISPDGYVVTNNHVVEKEQKVTLTLTDGRVVPAKVIGVDKKTDLALLKAEGSNFPYVEFASKSPRVGDWVIAVGNPFGLGGTVTAGIVSARGRDIGAGPYDDFLQIDAPVNRGNSGGPTFNTAGDVVGVNTAIYSPSGGSVGIGFAIPTDTVRNVVAALKDKGAVTRGWLGVQIQPVTPDIADSLGLKDAKGALVADVQKGSPAAEAGLKSGDVIKAMNGDAIDSPRDLSRKVATLGPDHKADLTLLRAGKSMDVSVTLGTLADQRAARATPAKASPLASLGLRLQPASEVAGAGKAGVAVIDVDPNGVGAEKGLRAGDVILEAAGKPVSRPAEIAAAVETARKDGQKAVLLRVKSGEGTRFVALATSPAA